jgi:riboflavin biosynthesis pyrimidine reductase
MSLHWLTETGTLPDILRPYAAAQRDTGTGRCWVMANMVGGLDGSASVQGRVGALSDATDHQLFLALRSLSDIVLVGAQTVRAEGYGPVRLPEACRAERIGEGRRPVPALAVVSRSLDLDWDAPAFAAADPAARTIVVTAENADPARLARAAEVADVVVAGSERVDIAEALAELGARGAGVVLCEGGPTLLGELAARDLLDELCLTLAPVIGGDPLPVSITPAGAPLVHFRLAHRLVETDTLYLRYERYR